ncbi:MAG: methyltransferase domain-containing protein [Chitinophagaceae bacterium]|nr:methyltransferase domain-containing protein [Chitinophagaceae bacterium]
MIAEEVKRKWNSQLTTDFGKRRSELCKAKDFYSSWYKRWCVELKEEPNLHRKQWEFVFIMQALWERGCIAKGKRGLVFAVGTEPLPSVFANYGCDILATDILPEEGIAKGWDNSNQLCLGLDSLYKCDICDRDTFYKRVEYLAVDMNHIPAELRNYDFNWSSCSFEHLGTIEKGAAFLKNQLKTLKPGGWAVHTTEYNISSNDETQDNNDTVIYRQRDIEQVVQELRNEGHFVEELDYSLGGLPEDFQVDIQPHQQKVHVKLQVDKYVVTSIGLIIRKKSA